MFGIGFPELLLILALALIVVGPDKLPEIARTIAKTLVDLKKTAEGLKDSFDEEDNPLKDIKPQLEDAAKNFKETILDEETKTWKPSQELEELKSVIDTTTHEPENLGTDIDDDDKQTSLANNSEDDDIEEENGSTTAPEETKSRKNDQPYDQSSGASQ